MDVALAILQRARGLVAKGWTKHVQARTPSGAETLVDDPNAAKFCIIGAMDRAWIELEGQGKTGVANAANACLNAVLSAKHNGNLAAWNDKPGRRKREVVAAFDEAIRRMNDEAGKVAA